MKQLLLCLLLVISVTVFAQDRAISAKELPKNAQSLIKETFNFQKVVQATMDVDNRETEYSFILEDQTKVECDANGDWTEIKSQNMPASLIPEEVAAYCSKNYPGLKIVKVERERSLMKFELSNDFDIFYRTDTKKISIDK